MSENNDQNVKISEMKTNICWLKKEVTEIRTQVFNHLPTQARTVKDELILRIQSVEDKMSLRMRSIENKILYGFVALIASVIITQIIISVFKWLY